MITGLEVENFKKFRHLSVPMRPLTVLTGLNGAGKSTLIQALLLAKQVTENPATPVVPLNDVHGLALGEAADILHPEAEEQIVRIRVRDELEIPAPPFEFEVPIHRSLNLPLHGNVPPPRRFDALGTTFTYLNAERLGPRDQLSVTAEDVKRLGVGERGQFTAQVLALNESEQVSESLRHPRTQEHGVTTLRTQVEEWASDIIRPMKITAKWLPGLSASTIRFQTPGLLGEEIRPGNTGFGFSYALPIIVAGLSMRQTGLLIVENPEAHLHPGGQSRIGRFLAKVAASGTQVLIETHSDHVINGVRLAVAGEDGIPHRDVLIHYFDDADPTGPSSIQIRPNGSLDSWPPGFFDQIEHDLGRIARAGRRYRGNASPSAGREQP